MVGSAKLQQLANHPLLIVIHGSLSNGDNAKYCSSTNDNNRNRKTKCVNLLSSRFLFCAVVAQTGGQGSGRRLTVGHACDEQASTTS